MKNSCVWYSQIITNKELGIEKFRDYVTQFDCGNRDISGDKGKNNGLTNAWFSSSLEIAP
ncbi:penicillin-binding transpeptidase domain-containing protein [Rickettsia rhipicephali]|uniref:penicillin-binding transpeptidase domain-containing protein n=1 Tax=Rickettsia rhipicephali TaxID=33992 RepID=UPI000B30CAA5